MYTNGLEKILTHTLQFHTLTGPDSSSGRASDSGAGGCRFDTLQRHTKDVQMVAATLLGAQHFKARNVFSSLKNIALASAHRGMEKLMHCTAPPRIAAH